MVFISCGFIIGPIKSLRSIFNSSKFSNRFLYNLISSIIEPILWIDILRKCSNCCLVENSTIRKSQNGRFSSGQLSIEHESIVPNFEQ